MTTELMQQHAEALRIAVEAERRRDAALQLVESQRAGYEAREALYRKDIADLTEQLVKSRERTLKAEQRANRLEELERWSQCKTLG